MGDSSGGRALLRLMPGRVLHTEGRRRGLTRSLFVRHIDGGSSNIVESELTAVLGPRYNLTRYGIRFVSSPSHADVLLLTGPLTRNMLGPLRAAFSVMPEPRAIVTAGDWVPVSHAEELGDPANWQVARAMTASYATVDLPSEMRPAILAHIPGDPPDPQEIIAALVRVARLRARRRRGRRSANGV